MLIRRLRRYTTDRVIIQLRDEVQVAIPGWMLDPVVCQHLSDEAAPRLSLWVLMDLRRLLDSQPLLTSGLAASRERASQHAGGDDARAHYPTTPTANVTVRPTRPLGAAS
jgi:hypothetical protein